MTDLQKNRDMAMRKAREYAQAGNVTMAQAYFDQAKRFWPVTDKQIEVMNDLLANANMKLVIKTVISSFA